MNSHNFTQQAQQQRPELQLQRVEDDLASLVDSFDQEPSRTDLLDLFSQASDDELSEAATEMESENDDEDEDERAPQLKRRHIANLSSNLRDYLQSLKASQQPKKAKVPASRKQSERQITISENHQLSELKVKQPMSPRSTSSSWSGFFEESFSDGIPEVEEEESPKQTQPYRPRIVGCRDFEDNLFCTE